MKLSIEDKVSGMDDVFVYHGGKASLMSRNPSSIASENFPSVCIYIPLESHMEARFRPRVHGSMPLSGEYKVESTLVLVDASTRLNSPNTHSTPNIQPYCKQATAS